MKKINRLFALAVAFLVVFTSCSKEVLDKFPGHGNGGNGHEQPRDTTKVPVPGGPGVPGKPVADSVSFQVKAAIQVGQYMYDSIPAILRVQTWDSSMVMHETTIELNPGTNRIKVPKAHTRVHLQLSQWGVTEEKDFTIDEVVTQPVIVMGGSKAAKKLKLEESFRYIQGNYYPNVKIVYHYNNQDKISKVDMYDKLPQYADLQLIHYNQYFYSGSKVSTIKMYKANQEQVATTEFTYDGLGRIVNMNQDSYGNKTHNSVEYSYSDGAGEITLYYLYDNGQAVQYRMNFSGGNKISDEATTSTGKGEGGSYGYDHYINPFIHMDMPTLYFANMSKNNMIRKQKAYSGAFPSVIPYKFEYRYDADGYPVELVESYKSPVTGEHLYKIKTVYTY